MKPTTTLALSVLLTGTAVILPPALSPAEERKAQAPAQQAAEAPALIGRDSPTDLSKYFLLGRGFITPVAPPVPIVPEGTKMTEELEATIALIKTRLVEPIHGYSNRRALMSRALVRMDVHYAMAITDTSDSLFPFDIYQRHHSGEWTKVASGVCHPGMESLKLANPKTGAMEEPIKHPLFAAILTEMKASEKAS